MSPGILSGPNFPGSRANAMKCNEAYAPNDVIPILPTAVEEIARLSLRIKTLKEKGLTHSLQKASGGGKKRKKATAVATENDATPNGTASTRQGSSLAVTVQPGTSVATSTTNIKNAATANLTAKVLGEQAMLNKRQKMAPNKNLNSLFTPRDERELSDKGSDFMSRGFSIPANSKKGG